MSPIVGGGLTIAGHGTAADTEGLRVPPFPLVGRHAASPCSRLSAGFTLRAAGLRRRGVDRRVSIAACAAVTVRSGSRGGADGCRREVSAQVTEGLHWSSSNSQVAEQREGLIIPRGNGTARLTVEHGGRTAEVEVTVRNYQATRDWTFRNDVAAGARKDWLQHGGLSRRSGGQRRIPAVAAGV